jgi:hypothetical protein
MISMLLEDPGMSRWFELPEDLHAPLGAGGGKDKNGWVKRMLHIMLGEYAQNNSHDICVHGDQHFAVVCLQVGRQHMMTLFLVVLFKYQVLVRRVKTLDLTFIGSMQQ